MGNKIFYFTGSGNSLAIARSLAEGLGDTELLPIATSMEGFHGTDEERVGIVSPVFGWGPPRMVADFLKRVRARESQYVFAVSSCAGTPGAALRKTERLLRSAGTRLDAGFAVCGDVHVKLPGGDEMGIIRFVNGLSTSTPGAFSKRRDEILGIIAAKRAYKPEVSNWRVNAIGSLMYGISVQFFKRAAKGFASTDACVSCGTCAKICPRENVSMVDGRPVWGKDCEMCDACVLWCPTTAIRLNGHPPTDPRHHPEISVGDMILR